MQDKKAQALKDIIVLLKERGFTEQEAAEILNKAKKIVDLLGNITICAENNTDYGQIIGIINSNGTITFKSVNKGG